MTARIISTSYTKPITKSGILSQDFMIKSLNKALELVGLNKSNLDGLLTVPSLSEPKFMVN